MNAILIGTKNPHKIKKMREMIEKYFDRIEYLADFEGKIKEAEEKGESFEEIAINKAKAYSEQYNGYVIAGDGGLEVPALGKNWNALLTKRFIGKENASDFERLDAFLELMKDKQGDERKSYWHEAIAIAKDSKKIFSAEEVSVPTIIQESYDSHKHRPGIWLCSLFYYPQYGKNFFDLTEEELEEDGEDTWRELGEKVKRFLMKK